MGRERESEGRGGRKEKVGEGREGREKYGNV